LNRGIGGALALAGTFVALCCGAAPAFATAGATIASAPAVSYGVQEFGNTATDSTSAQGLCDGDSVDTWWLLPVLAGDKVTIDFEGAGWAYEAVYAVGTTDFSISQNRAPVQFEHRPGNGFGQAVFSAAQDGSMPLDFATYDCDFGPSVDPGPYDFTASVQHKVVLGLGLTRTSRRRHRSNFALQVHRPDGQPLSDPNLRATAQLLTHGRWVNLASGEPPYTFTIHWSPRYRGHWQSVRVIASGSGYLNATSRVLRVKAG
jgi:hypothetical protein